MPVAARDGNAMLFDVAACRKWREMNRPEGVGRGGKQPGAGRPKKNAAPTPPPPPAIPPTIRPLAAAAAELDEDAAASSDSLSQVLNDPTCRLLKPAEAKVLADQVRASKTHTENLKLTGAMIDREEATAAWAQALTVMVRAMDNMPARVVGGLMDAAIRLHKRLGEVGEDQHGLEIERAELVMLDVLRRGVGDVRRVMVEDPLFRTEKPVEQRPAGMAAG